jgi:hypothetical protein
MLYKETESFMVNPEREKTGKHVDYHNLLVTSVLHLGVLRGFPPHKMDIDAKTEKQDKDGTKHIRVEPYLLGSVKQKDLGPRSGNKFLLHNPYDKTEKFSYLVAMDERDWADGETTKQIALSKIPSPHTYENKRGWVTEVVEETIKPYTRPVELQTEECQFPTLLITLYSEGASINYSGELDRFLGEVYAFFPDKEE